MKLTLSKFLQKILEIRQIYGDVDVELAGFWMSPGTNTLELIDRVAQNREAMDRVNKQTQIDTLRRMLVQYEQADGYGLGMSTYPSDQV